MSQDLGELVGTRWRESDDRERRLLALTRSVARLTWALLLATVVLAVWTILNG